MSMIIVAAVACIVANECSYGLVPVLKATGPNPSAVVNDGPATGDTQCQPCVQGTYYEYTDTGGACVECPAGQFKGPLDIQSQWPQEVQLGQGSINLKAAGISSNTKNPNLIGCLHCAPGQYAPASGMTGCVKCPAGTYQPNYGQTSCIYCAGAPEEAINCRKCPAGAYWGHMPVQIHTYAHETGTTYEIPKTDEIVATQCASDNTCLTLVYAQAACTRDAECIGVIGGGASVSTTDKKYYPVKSKKEASSGNTLPDFYAKQVTYPWEDPTLLDDVGCNAMLHPALDDAAHYKVNGEPVTARDIAQMYSGSTLEFNMGSNSLWGRNVIDDPHEQSTSEKLFPFTSIEMRNLFMCGTWSGSPALYKDCAVVAREFKQSVKRSKLFYLPKTLGYSPGNAPDALYARPITWLFEADTSSSKILTYAKQMQVNRNNSLYYNFKHPMRAKTCLNPGDDGLAARSFASAFLNMPDWASAKPEGTCPKCPAGRFASQEFDPPESIEPTLVPKQYPIAVPLPVKASDLAKFTVQDKSWPIPNFAARLAGCQPCDIPGYGAAIVKGSIDVENNPLVINTNEGNVWASEEQMEGTTHCLKCTPGRISTPTPSGTHICMQCPVNHVTLSPPAGTTWGDYIPANECHKCPAYTDCPEGGVSRTNSTSCAKTPGGLSNEVNVNLTAWPYLDSDRVGCVCDPTETYNTYTGECGKCTGAQNVKGAFSVPDGTTFSKNPLKLTLASYGPLFRGDQPAEEFENAEPPHIPVTYNLLQEDMLSSFWPSTMKQETYNSYQSGIDGDSTSDGSRMNDPTKAWDLTYVEGESGVSKVSGISSETWWQSFQGFKSNNYLWADTDKDPDIIHAGKYINDWKCQYSQFSSKQATSNQVCVQLSACKKWEESWSTPKTPDNAACYSIKGALAAWKYWRAQSNYDYDTTSQLLCKWNMHYMTAIGGNYICSIDSDNQVSDAASMHWKCTWRAGEQHDHNAMQGLKQPTCGWRTHSNFDNEAPGGPWPNNFEGDNPCKYYQINYNCGSKKCSGGDNVGLIGYQPHCCSAQQYVTCRDGDDGSSTQLDGNWRAWTDVVFPNWYNDGCGNPDNFWKNRLPSSCSGWPSESTDTSCAPESAQNLMSCPMQMPTNGLYWDSFGDATELYDRCKTTPPLMGQKNTDNWPWILSPYVPLATEIENNCGMMATVTANCKTASADDYPYTQSGTLIRGAQLYWPHYSGLPWNSDVNLAKWGTTLKSAKAISSGTVLGIDATTTLTTCNNKNYKITHCPAGKYFVKRPGWYLDNYIRKPGSLPTRLSTALTGQENDRAPIPDAWCVDRCKSCPPGKYVPELASGTASATWGWAGSHNSDANWPNNNMVTSPVRKSLSFGSEGHFCLTCPAGKYADAEQSTGCKKCLAGKFAYHNGLTKCNDCPTGFYSNSYGQTACAVCPGGKFGANVAQMGNTGCKKCKAGQYRTAISTTTDFINNAQLCMIWNDAIWTAKCEDGHSWIKNMLNLTRCEEGTPVDTYATRLVFELCAPYKKCADGYFLYGETCWLGSRTYVTSTKLSFKGTSGAPFGVNWQSLELCAQACDSNKMCAACKCNPARNGCRMQAFYAPTYSNGQVELTSSSGDNLYPKFIAQDQISSSSIDIKMGNSLVHTSKYDRALRKDYVLESTPRASNYSYNCTPWVARTGDSFPSSDYIADYWNTDEESCRMYCLENLDCVGYIRNDFGECFILNEEQMNKPNQTGTNACGSECGTKKCALKLGRPSQYELHATWKASGCTTDCGGCNFDFYSDKTILQILQDQWNWCNDAKQNIGNPTHEMGCCGSVGCGKALTCTKLFTIPNTNPQYYVPPAQQDGIDQVPTETGVSVTISAYDCQHSNKVCNSSVPYSFQCSGTTKCCAQPWSTGTCTCDSADEAQPEFPATHVNKPDTTTTPLAKTCGTCTECLNPDTPRPAYEHNRIPGLWIASAIIYSTGEGEWGLLMFGFSVYNCQLGNGPTVGVFLPKDAFSATFGERVSSTSDSPPFRFSGSMLSAAWSSPFAVPYKGDSKVTSFSLNLPCGCTTCPTGQYSEKSASSECSICPPGQFSEATGRTECSACKSGQYQAQAGQPTCPQCAPGQYASEESSTACTYCPVGKHQIGTGEAECALCGGKDGACFVESETPDAPGTDCTMTKPDCELAAFQMLGNASNYNMGSDALCYIGNGPVQIKVCRLKDVEPQQGEPEHLSWQCNVAGIKKKCTAESCTTCAPGEYTDVLERTCKICPASKYQSYGGQTQCTPCPTGTVAAIRDDEQVTRGTSKAEACRGCNAGSYCAKECAADVKNVAGSFCELSAQRAYCCPCPAGKYSEPLSSSCVDCELGQYQEKPGQSTCTECRINTYADQQGSIACKQCEQGKFSQAGQSICQACPAGKRVSTGQASCTDCRAGRFAPTTASSCLACPAGKHQPQPGQSSCDDCEPGRYAPAINDGITNCLTCPKGEFATNTTSAKCLPCPSGKFGSELGICSSCTEGRFQNDAGKKTCVDCPAGKFAPSTSSSECTSCPAGKHSPAASASCQDCNAGTYAEPDNTKCTPCSAGTFSNTPGEPTCKSCPAGQYQRELGQTNCNMCPSGKYNGEEGQTSCSGDGCMYGTVSSREGATTASQAACSTCPGGKYSDLKRVTCNGTCPAGRYFTASLVSTANPVLDALVPALGISIAEQQCTFHGYDGICTTDPDATACAFSKNTDGTDGQEGNCEGTVPVQVRCCTDPVKFHCWPCPVNNVTSTPGSSDCSESCGSTPRTSNAQRTACIDCIPGRFRTPNSDICELCPDPLFQDEPGKASCLQCPNVAQGEQPILNHSSCEMCSAGRYLANQLSCVTCPVGKYTPTGGLLSCETCPDGQFNYIKDNHAQPCQLCPPGQFRFATGRSDTNSSGCQYCPSGKYTAPVYRQITSVVRPILQDPNVFGPLTTKMEVQHNCSTSLRCLGYVQNGSGFYYFARPNTVVSAPVGTQHYFSKVFMRTLQGGVSAKVVADTDYTACFDCPLGQQPTAQHDSCVECAAGQYGASAGSVCLNCTEGTYTTSAAQSSCELCDVGRSTPTGSAGPCAKCVPGFFAAAKGVPCQACPAGKFQGAEGTSGCLLCSAVSTSADGAKVCDNCTAGHVASQDRTQCVECKNEQKWRSNTAPGCKDCPEGTFGNKTLCTACHPGQYGPGLAKGCILCASGQYQSQAGQLLCQDCHVGEHQASTGASNCSACDSGQYTDVVGTVVCKDCPVGKHQSSTGSPSCTLCMGTSTTTLPGQATCNAPCQNASEFTSGITIPVPGVIYAIVNTTTDTTVVSTAEVDQVTLCGVTIKHGTRQADNKTRLLISKDYLPEGSYTTFVRFKAATGRRLSESSQITATVEYGPFCQYGTWGSYGSCSPKCASNSTQVIKKTRTRQLVFSHPPQSAACTETSLSIACDAQTRCPIDCVVSQWGNYGPCSASCNHGRKERARLITTPSQFNGKSCAAVVEFSKCGAENCPVDCMYTSQFVGMCTATCGFSGTQRTVNMVTQKSEYGGHACPERFGNVPCNRISCPGEVENNIGPLAAGTAVLCFVSILLALHVTGAYKRVGYSSVSSAASDDANHLPSLRRRQIEW